MLTHSPRSVGVRVALVWITIARPSSLDNLCADAGIGHAPQRAPRPALEVPAPWRAERRRRC